MLVRTLQYPVDVTPVTSQLPKHSLTVDETSGYAGLRAQAWLGPCLRSSTPDEGLRAGGNRGSCFHRKFISLML